MLGGGLPAVCCVPCATACAPGPLPPTTHPLSTTAPGNFTYTSASTGLTYILSTFKKTWADAETFCQTQGGHLVAYSSSSQQREVEQAYVGEGYLLPYFHVAYHVGLTQTSTWNYTDYFFRKTSYLPWDKTQPSGAGTCGVANTRTQRNGIFVFNDAPCAVERPFICLVHCGWLLTPAAPLPPALNCVRSAVPKTTAPRSLTSHLARSARHHHRPQHQRDHQRL